MLMTALLLPATLLILLLVCHYVADFCLTLPMMIRAKADGRRAWPILLHATVHAILMGASLAVCGVGWGLILQLMVLELVTHFAIDTMKGRLTNRFTLLADQRRRPYWMLYGLDQLLHQLVVVAIWYISLS